jgi:hypothetical protein
MFQQGGGERITNRVEGPRHEDSRDQPHHTNASCFFPPEARGQRMLL